MEIQFGKNPEYTMFFIMDLGYWALPLCIYWTHIAAHGKDRNFSISIKFLCFGFELEVWKWSEND